MLTYQDREKKERKEFWTSGRVEGSYPTWPFLGLSFFWAVRSNSNLGKGSHGPLNVLTQSKQHGRQYNTSSPSLEYCNSPIRLAACCRDQITVPTHRLVGRSTPYCVWSQPEQAGLDQDCKRKNDVRTVKNSCMQLPTKARCIYDYASWLSRNLATHHQ